MLFQLSDSQINSFAGLPSSTTPKSDEAFTLPFKAEKYARRVSPEDAMDLDNFVIDTRGNLLIVVPEAGA